MFNDVLKLYQEVNPEQKVVLEQILPDTTNAEYLNGALHIGSSIYDLVCKENFEKLFLDKDSHKRMLYFVGLVITRVLYLQKLNEQNSSTIH